MNRPSNGFAKWMAFFLVIFCLVNPKEATGRANRTEASRPRIKLPIRIYHDYLVVVKGRIGTLTEQNLIVDTGTAPTILDASVVGNLGLKVSKGILEGVGGDKPSQVAMVPDLEVGPIQRTGFQVFVGDLSFLKRDLGIPIAGIVGLDVLGERDFRLDYAAREIVFDPTENENEVLVPFEAHSPLVILKLQVDKEPFRLLLDTGAAGLIFFRSEAGSRMERKAAFDERNGTGVGGSFSVREINPGNILVGGKRFRLEKAFLANDKSMDDRGFDGLMGVGALGFKSVTFHFAEHTVSFVK